MAARAGRQPALTMRHAGSGDAAAARRHDDAVMAVLAAAVPVLMVVVATARFMAGFAPGAARDGPPAAGADGDRAVPGGDGRRPRVRVAAHHLAEVLRVDQ